MEKFWLGFEKLMKKIQSNKIWLSIFRHEYPQTEKSRMAVMVNNFFLHIHPVKVYKHSLEPYYTFGLGVIAFVLFLILTVTGVLLMFYYVPDIHQAYQNVKDLQFAVSYGTLLRNMHRWSAHTMMLIVILHMMRVFYAGAYKTPREFNWGVGVILLVITFLLSFTGYLLPWDQIAYWAITIGTNMAGYAPLFNTPSKFILLGGLEVGQNTLLRFYVLHIVVFPLVAAIFMAVHFWRIRKDGGISGPL